MSVGSRLKFAREASGFTLQLASEKSKIGLSSISEYESDSRTPRLQQLKRLADLYRRPTSFFLDETPIPEEVVLWRARPSDQDATDIQSVFLELCRQYHNLEMWCDEHSLTDLPCEVGTVHGFDYRRAERLAGKVRTVLKLGDRPGLTLHRVLEEECGLKIFHWPLNVSGSAACTYDESFGPAILLNSKHTRWRRNFDLAHELFHILTWTIFRSNESNDTKEYEDKLANHFASCLLMPWEPLKERIDQAITDNIIYFSDLFDIARQYDISVEALCWRMLKMKFFNNEEETKNTIARYKIRMSEWECNRDHDAPPTRPERFVALAKRALWSGNISIGKYSDYMDVSRQEAMRIAEQEALGDEEISVTPA